ncbi:hypothetical protein RIF29_09109 [Crotalaria pallida]|uniref:peroxidase n=1 Tax=Crotalaria pallida TaxID=3830 RepID=A0AAN9FXX3_CROPI
MIFRLEPKVKGLEAADKEPASSAIEELTQEEKARQTTAMFGTKRDNKKKLGGYLYPQFYDYSCPRAQEIVKSILARAVANEPRIAALLLRLHFHDYFELR